MSKPFLRLICGTRSLDLNDQARYWLSTNFVPPEVALEPQFAGGSSANVTGGAILSGLRAVNRTLSFTVGIQGTSDAQIGSAVRAVSRMLKLAGDDVTPLYLEYKPNDDVPEPLWGNFGVKYRYEVVLGIATLSEGYLIGTRRSSDVNLDITLTIKPYSIGKAQRICTANGGVCEDTIGSVDGQSRGLIVPEGTTNKMTNPVFGHATWNNTWVAGANISATQNTVGDWLIPGTISSARVTCSAAGANTFAQSINVGNTNAHSLGCYARLPDGGVLSSTQVQLYYNAALTTTFQSLGNGWYWLRAENVVGINAGAAAGVIVAAGYTVYVTGFQIEEKAYSTLPCWGDLTGCAWTGTAHASTSTRTAASCKISVASDTISLAAFSLRAVVRFDVANTFGSNMVIVDVRDGGNLNAPILYFDATTDKISLIASGVTVTSAALTFSAGTTYVIHATGGPAGLALYLNGAQVDTDTYTIASPGANLCIGTSSGAASQFAGVIRGAATFDVALTAAQVLADYNSISPLVTASQRVDAIPWFWTLSGDKILSVDTGKSPLGIVAGVPGSAPAVTEMQGHLSSSWSVIKSIALSNFPCAEMLKLADFFGSVNATATVNGANISLGTFSASVLASKMLESAEFYAFVKLYGSAATSFYLFDLWAYGGGSQTTSDTRLITPVASSPNYRMFRTKPNVIMTDRSRFTNITPGTIGYTVYGNKNASNVDITVAYINVLPRPVMFLTNGTLALAAFYYKRFTAHQSDTGTGVLTTQLNVTGDVIEFEPGLYNHLQCVMCPDETVNPLNTYQCTLDAMYVTPRYALL